MTDTTRLLDWLGRITQAEDQVSTAPIKALSATLDRDDPAPQACDVDFGSTERLGEIPADCLDDSHPYGPRAVRPGISRDIAETRRRVAPRRAASMTPGTMVAKWRPIPLVYWTRPRSVCAPGRPAGLSRLERGSGMSTSRFNANPQNYGPRSGPV